VAGKPGFSHITLMNGSVQVVGESPKDLPLPHSVHVTLVQESATGEGPSHIAEGPVDAPAHDWHASLPSDGFRKGPALVVGWEISFLPQFSVTTWQQVKDIE
jgi:hypothetical protein